MNRLVMTACALALSAGAAMAETAANAHGVMLTDAQGMTLYTFDNDAEGVSNCADQCAVNWPILAAAEGAVAEGDFTVIARADGASQWAYKGLPLYTFIGDTAPGDVTGDGVNEVWHIARP